MSRGHWFRTGYRFEYRITDENEADGYRLVGVYGETITEAKLDAPAGAVEFTASKVRVRGGERLEYRGTYRRVGEVWRKLPA